ncbi:MAG: hypothetical protein ABW185_03195 [Sedimenticola sp.]
MRYEPAIYLFDPSCQFRNHNWVFCLCTAEKSWDLFLVEYHAT